MKKIKEFLYDFGICYKHNNEIKPNLGYGKYESNGDENFIKEHRDFLKNLEEKEDKRLESIDNKTSSLISQTAIVFSLVSLFIPFLIEKTSGVESIYKIMILVLLFLSSSLYVMTIINSLKNYKINSFRYIQSSPKNVLNPNNNSISSFLIEEISDLLYGIPINRRNNDRKGTNLLHAYNSFKWANITTALIIGLLCIKMAFIEKAPESTDVNGIIEVKELNNIIKSFSTKKDTIIITINNSK
ncbi:hypothetical protein [Sphingobacterium multivorum]|uniref:hypothetical protein n=1 Tax=Sphingobacterium multivorum TaxID=28454 RepID=UPI0028A93645|nr:hypothetical protein [Sphingobacterium multivorum]